MTQALRALSVAWLLALGGCAGWPPAGGAGEPGIARFSAEDDQVRIDELRVRGQLKRAAVSPKSEGTPPYEVLTPTEGHDPSKGNDATGQRVWNVLTF